MSISLSRLYYENPAGDWIRRKFSISMPLTNGPEIVVQFDILSAGKDGFGFSPERVDKLFGEFIDYGRKTKLPLDEYEDVCAAIADNLNTQLAVTALEVLSHAQSSYSILGYLVLGKKTEAAAQCLKLGLSLMEYEPASSQARWGDWIMLVNEACLSEDDLGV